MVCPETAFKHTHTPLPQTHTDTHIHTSMDPKVGIILQKSPTVLTLARFKYAKCFSEPEDYKVHPCAAVSTEPSSQQLGKINPRENKLNWAIAVKVGQVECSAD